MTSVTFHLTSDPKPRPRFTRGGGVKAQRAGRSFEEMVEFSAGIYKDFVTLEHLPRLGAKVLPGGKKVVTRICVDFIGTLAGGRGLFCDAKNCGTDTKGFDANRWHAEAPHQSAFLRRMAKAGAMAGLLVRAEERGLYLWADIDDVDVMDTLRFAYDGKLARQWRDLGPTSGFVRFDWLARSPA